MRGSLGEKINQGGTADIHAWAPGQVVKLFKEGFPPWLGQQEARMAQQVFARRRASAGGVRRGDARRTLASCSVASTR